MHRALISVSDKTNLEGFAEELWNLGFALMGSQGTANYLEERGADITSITTYVNTPPVLRHRVVTLHPKVHGGLITAEDQRPEMKELGFEWIDLLYVNFYDLRGEVERPGATLESIHEKMDIGGPTMLMSAVKGLRFVLCDPEDLSTALSEIRSGAWKNLDTRLRYIKKARALHKAYYEPYDAFLERITANAA